MSYRDELDAAQARADALQRRVDELEAAQAAKPAPVVPVARVGHAATRALTIGAVIAVVGGVGLLAAAVSLDLRDAVRIQLGVMGAILVCLGGTVGIMISQLVVAGPDEALIVSGGRGGPRVIAPGMRRVLVPIVEQAHRLDLRPIDVTARVVAAYTRAGTPLDLSTTAVIRIARTHDAMLAASERFLGKPTAEIATIASQTLEGAARGLVAELTPDMVRLDPDKLDRALIEAASPDLERMGLELETLTANVVG